MEIVENGVRYKKVLGNMMVLGFSNGHQTVNLNIPEFVQGMPVTEIGATAFKNSNIETLILPCTLIIIHESAFENCCNLDAVSINDLEDSYHKIQICQSAFKNCKKLTAIDTLSAMADIEAFAFDGCESLDMLELLIQDLQKCAFSNCVNLLQLFVGENACLHENCLSGCNIKKLCTIGDIDIHSNTLDHILKNDIEIYCTSDSNLLDLAYEGYVIKAFSEDETYILDLD